MTTADEGAAGAGAGAGPARAVGAASGAAARGAVVIVASTRAASGVYADKTGPVIGAWLAERGWTT